MQRIQPKRGDNYEKEEKKKQIADNVYCNCNPFMFILPLDELYKHEDSLERNEGIPAGKASNNTTVRKGSIKVILSG